MKRYNIALKGGAAHGLAYSQLIKEIDDKNVLFNKLSGTSAGALFGSMIACGMNFQEIKTILKKLPYDRIMRWERDVELGQGFIGCRILKAVAILFFTKTFLFKKMKKMLKNNISWGKVKQAKRTKELWVCTINKQSLAGQFGSDKYSSIIDMIVAMKKKKGFKKMAKEIKPIWFTQSGTYQYEDECLIKISKDKPELWKCVFSSFYNPAFKRLENVIRIKKGYWMFSPLDGGIADNNAVTCHHDHTFINVCCSHPDKEPSLSDYYKKKKKAIKRVYITTKTPFKKVGFLSFFNKMVNKEFSDDTKPTNIFNS